MIKLNAIFRVIAYFLSTKFSIQGRLGQLAIEAVGKSNFLTVMRLTGDVRWRYGLQSSIDAQKPNFRLGSKYDGMSCILSSYEFSDHREVIDDMFWAKLTLAPSKCPVIPGKSWRSAK